MIKKLFSWLISPLGRIGLLIVGLIVLSVAVWGISLTQTSPEQPIEFPHDRHIWDLASNACTAIPAHRADRSPACPRRPNAGAAISRWKSPRPANC